MLVQQGLTALDYPAGVADGLFGPSTCAALRQWQRGKGFAVTGYLTPEQADALIAQGREVVAALRQQEEARRQAEAERAAQEEAARQAREADDTAYAEAWRIDTATAYEAYLAAYPQGRHVEEARTRQRAEAERWARERAAEAQRRAREMEEQRARLAARRAECEADVDNWPRLDQSQQSDLELSWQTISVCLSDCVRTIQRPRGCEAERAAYAEAKRRYEDYIDDSAGYLLEGAIAGATLGLSFLLHDESEIRQKSMNQARDVMNGCMSKTAEEEDHMHTCMTSCCAEM